MNQKPKPETPLDGTGSEEKGKNNSDEEVVKLNEALLKWITGHIKDDPICDLRPIFEDYKNHMTALDQVYNLCPIGRPLRGLLIGPLRGPTDNSEGRYAALPIIVRAATRPYKKAASRP